MAAPLQFRKLCCFAESHRNFSHTVSHLNSFTEIVKDGAAKNSPKYMIFALH